MSITPVEPMDLQEDKHRPRRRSTFDSLRRFSQAPFMISKLMGQIREKQALDWEQCAMNTRVFHALKPLMLTCYATGLLFNINFRRDGLRKYVTRTHLYSVLVMIFVAANVARYLMIIHDSGRLDTIFLLKIAIVVHYVECCVHFLCFYVATITYKRLPEFFVEWEKVHTNCSIPLTWVKRQAYIITIVLWIIVMTGVSFTTYLAFGTHMQDMMLVPLDADHPLVNLMKGVNIVVGIFETVAYLAPSAFMFMLAKILSYEFVGLTKYIKELAESDTTKIEASLERIRRYHQRLCNLVGHADDIFSMQIAVTFCGSFCISCLIMYVIIYDEPPDDVSRVYLIIMEAFWLLMSLGRMLMDCISGAMLNGAVSIGPLYMRMLQIQYAQLI